MRHRCTVPKIPTKSPVPSRLPLYKNRLCLTHSESTLLQVLIPLHFNSTRISVYRKPGEGTPPLYPKVLQLVTNASSPRRPHTNSRNPNPLYGLLHGPLDTRGVGSRLAAQHSPALSEVEGSLATISLRILFFAHPHHLTLIESYSCKKTRGVGCALRATIYLLSTMAPGLAAPIPETLPRIRCDENKDRSLMSPCVSLAAPGIPRGSL
jgi:hypothetical protein